MSLKKQHSINHDGAIGMNIKRIKIMCLERI